MGVTDADLLVVRELLAYSVTRNKKLQSSKLIIVVY